MSLAPTPGTAEPGPAPPPPPVIDVDSQPFWEAARQGRFVVNRCRTCRRALIPPMERCPCGEETSFETASGFGEIYSFIVVRHPSVPAFVADIPYVVALIELDEGARLPGRLLEATGPDVKIGERVSVELIEVPGAAEPVVAFRRLEQ